MFGVGKTNQFAGCKTAREVAEVVDDFADESEQAKKFADVVGASRLMLGAMLMEQTMQSTKVISIT